MNKKENKDRLFIISSFMDYTLLTENYPKSVYNFCKKNDIQEKAFTGLSKPHVIINLLDRFCKLSAS